MFISRRKKIVPKNKPKTTNLIIVVKLEVYFVLFILNQKLIKQIQQYKIRRPKVKRKSLPRGYYTTKYIYLKIWSLFSDIQRRRNSTKI